MAKVYEVKDGQKIQITTLDDIDLKNKQEDVELLIEDDLKTKISLDQGERYIFGGNTQPGRWICVQGLKMWYSGINLGGSSGYDEDHILLNNIEIENKQIIITDTQTQPSRIVIPENNFTEALYFHFNLIKTGESIETNNRESNFNNCTISFRENTQQEVVALLGNLGYLASRDTNFLYFNDINDFSQFGFLFNVSEIVPPVTTASDEYKNGYVSINIIPIIVRENGYDIASWDAEDISNSKTLLTNNLHYMTGQKHFYRFTTPFASLYEYYYAIGLRTIYEKKTLDDVKQILSPTESNS